MGEGCLILMCMATFPPALSFHSFEDSPGALHDIQSLNYQILLQNLFLCDTAEFEPKVLLIFRGTEGDLFATREEVQALPSNFLRGTYENEALYRCLISFIFNLHSECRKPLLAVNIRESEPKHILEGFPVWDF
ncbi:hypothetical protein Anapl_13424 [Anas platyrhynchos]|uniref:Uncharacterized protein n=1 Tax=Anas platyrhynchos TaxID=8839 RepID=R0KY47_ANAPL|nr:hypothetical protein Anapl_13424 [Anas platyrhynchos]